MFWFLFWPRNMSAVLVSLILTTVNKNVAAQILAAVTVVIVEFRLLLLNVIVFCWGCGLFVLLQVAGLFQDASIGNSINIVVVRLILLEKDEVKRVCMLSHHIRLRLGEPFSVLWRNPQGVLWWYLVFSLFTSTLWRYEDYVLDCFEKHNSLDFWP